MKQHIHFTKLTLVLSVIFVGVFFATPGMTNVAASTIVPLRATITPIQSPTPDLRPTPTARPTATPDAYPAPQATATPGQGYPAPKPQAPETGIRRESKCTQSNPWERQICKIIRLDF